MFVQTLNSVHNHLDYIPVRRLHLISKAYSVHISGSNAWLAVDLWGFLSPVSCNVHLVRSSCNFHCPRDWSDEFGKCELAACPTGCSWNRCVLIVHPWTPLSCFFFLKNVQECVLVGRFNSYWMAQDFCCHDLPIIVLASLWKWVKN